MQAKGARGAGRPVDAGPELARRVEFARHPRRTLQHHEIRGRLGGWDVSTLRGIQASRGTLVCLSKIWRSLIKALVVGGTPGSRYHTPPRPAQYLLLGPQSCCPGARLAAPQHGGVRPVQGAAPLRSLGQAAGFSGFRVLS